MRLMSLRVRAICELNQCLNRQSPSLRHVRAEHSHQRRDNAELRHGFPPLQILLRHRLNLHRRRLLLFPAPEVKFLHRLLQNRPSPIALLFPLHNYSLLSLSSSSDHTIIRRPIFLRRSLDVQEEPSDSTEKP